ncbi:DUF5666 domain-containing protein [Nocardia sp. NPDC004722]
MPDPQSRILSRSARSERYRPCGHTNCGVTHQPTPRDLTVTVNSVAAMTSSTHATGGSEPLSGRRRHGKLVRTVAGVALALTATLGLAACGSSDHSSQAGNHEQGPGDRKGGGRGVGGKIASEGSGSWVITKQDGSSETVAISATTEFGSKAKSETAAQFVVGDQVMVQGQESNGTIAATRIIHARERGNGTPGATPPSSGSAAPSATPTK